MTSRSESPSGKRLAGLGISATLAAAAGIYALLLNAQDPELAILDAERQATTALKRFGYSWARVRVEDGVAHISGIAPGEPERVLAYEVVYKTLRPEMTRTMNIRRVASHLTLPVEISVGSDLPPPDADFGKPAASPDVAEVPDLVAEAAEAAEQQLAPPHSGTTWNSADAAPLPRIAAEATVAQAAPANPGTTWQAAIEAPLPRVPEQAQVFASIEIATDRALPATASAVAAAGPEVSRPEVSGATTGSIETTALETPPARALTTAASEPVAELTALDSVPTAELTTAAIEKPAPPSTADCKAQFAAAQRRAGISFASTSATISAESKITLDKLADIAKRCSHLSIAVEGHTDGYGERSYNLSLSRKRAEAVRRAMIARGVPWRRVAAKGYGATRPLTRDPALAARNRRIEFSVSEPASTRSPRGAQLK